MEKSFFKFNLLLICLLAIFCFASCNSENSESTVYVEKIPVCDDAIIGIVESYTSGLISDSEPLKIKLVQGLKMKKQFGEELPSKLFEITPKIAGHAMWIDKNTVGFQFDETPKTSTPYSVDFNLGMLVEMPVNERVMQTSFVVRKQNDNASELNEKLSDSIKSAPKPKVKWSDDGVIVPEVADATVSFDAICLNAVILRIIKVYDNNIMSYLQDEGLDSQYGSMNRVGRLVKKIRIPLEQENYSVWQNYKIKLSDYIDLKAGDMYQINLDFDMTCYPYACDNEKVAKGYDNSYWGNENYDYRVYYFDEWDYENPCSQCYYNYVDIRKNLYVSNLAITAKSSDADYIDVFVKNITDATPASSVKVYLFDYQMQNVGESTTDADGYAKIQFTNKPYFVVAENSVGSKSYLPLNKNKSLSLSKFDVAGNAVEHDVDGFIYSNRDVWRPGDSIQLNLMISDKNDYFANDYPVVLEVIDPNGRLYVKKANNSPVGKIYAFTINTLTSDPTGTWNARFKIGNQVFSKYLRIETVKPNRLKINFEPKDLISLNGKETVALHSTRLNGLNVNNLKATITVILSNTTTSFKGFENYDFNCIANDFYSREMTLYSAALNAEGKANISFDALKNVSAPGFMKAIYNIKVFENSGDFSITSRSGKISPFRRYVGVSLPETKSKWGDYYFTNQDWKFDVVVVNENGTLAQNDIELEYQLYKLDNYWWWDNDSYDLMRYVRGSYKRPVKSGVLEARNGKSSLTLNIKDADWGSYLLVINDPIGKHTFSKVLNFDWAYGARSSSVGDAPAIITLKTDKDTYNVGETMKVSFPANKNSKAIVTVESSSKVIEVIHLQNLTEDATIGIPVTEEMLPNAYVAVSLIQPFRNENGMPIRMYGVVPFKVSDSKTIINPIVEVPETAASNKTIDIKVSEKQGNKMYYTVAVVDEGILGLTGYKTADPCGYFFSKRALGVRTWDNYDYIVSAITDMMQGTLAAGGDMFIKPETTLLERFQAIATMMGPFELKAGTTDIQHFNIPDYNGSLRVMVVASNGKDAFGSTQKNITVKDKIMILPTAPRVIGIGDEVLVNMKVIASEFAGETTNLNIKFENLESTSNIPTSVSLDKNGEAEVAFSVKAKEIKGNAKVSMTVSCNGFESVKSVSMPIRMPSSNKYNSVKQEIKPNETATLHIDCQGFDGTIETKLVASTGIPVDLFKHIDYLTSYPYGCLEQTVSKAFPQLYLQNLVSLDETTKAEMRTNVENAVANLNAHLLQDFSMTAWPNGNYVDPWSEIYALHFLVEARNQGYNVANSLIDGMIKHQTNRAKAWNYSADAPNVETIQAYRLFVLALNNTAEVGAMNRLKELEMKFPLTKALTAASYALVGKANIASDLIPTIDFNAKGWTSDYYITLGSKVRDMSMCIYAEMLANDNTEMVQNDIEELCRILGSDRWLDTQTTAMAMFVLGKYAEKLGIKDNSISLVVKEEDKTENITTNRSSITYNMQPKRGDNAVTITNNGNSSVFVTLFTKGKVAEYQREDAGAWYEMSVKYFDKKGNEINTAQIKQNTDFDVVITVSNPHEYQVTENALSYHAASGWEIVNSRLFGDNSKNEAQAKHIEYQDDCVNFFFDMTPHDTKTFRLSLNAAYQGTFIIPSVTCEDMYNNQIWFNTAAKKTTVVK